MTAGTVRVERLGAVAVITLDRPGRRNALDETMWRELGAAADSFATQLPRAIVLTGAGDTFSAGMDVNPDNPQVARLVAAVASGDAGPPRAMLDGIHAELTRLFSLPVPLIAAINGLAYGGGAEIATRCDLRVIDPAATICFSETRLGLMPDLGGGVALARLLGPGRAADLILTARKLDASEALALGFANRVSQPGAARAEAIELANQIAVNGPRAVRAALGILRRAYDMPWPEAVANEVSAAASLIATGECQQGIMAVLGRTAPQFRDPE